jgi:hypothetical protein
VEIRASCFEISGLLREIFCHLDPRKVFRILYSAKLRSLSDVKGQGSPAELSMYLPKKSIGILQFGQRKVAHSQSVTLRSVVSIVCEP